MLEEKRNSKNSMFFFTVLLTISLLFLFSNFLNLNRDPGMFLIHPINDISFRTSESVKGFLYVFEDIKNLRKEFFDLKEQYLILKSESTHFNLLKEENTLLKKELNIEDARNDRILAQVLYQDMDLRTENLILNKGKEDGIQTGDYVVFGEIYVGLITDVNLKTSKVRLPTSRASSVQVMILEENDDVEITQYMNGIALGYSNMIKVENIELLGNIVEGNKIIVNDIKVGEYLYLGDVYSIDDDPTATFRTCGIKLPLSYKDLNYVFVKRR